MKRLHYTRLQVAKVLLLALAPFALHLSPLALLQSEALAEANFTSRHVCLGRQVTHFKLLNGGTGSPIGRPTCSATATTTPGHPP
jgi:hypothetical protein